MQSKDKKVNKWSNVDHLIPKAAIQKFFNIFGLQILRKKNTPLYTLLGLKNMPIRTIIDIGANRGQFAKSISNMFPSARLFCFEPLPEPYTELQKWAKRQKKGRVSAINAAIGMENREITMMLHEEHTPSSSILPITEKTAELYPQTRRQKPIQVQQKTLDDILYNEKLEDLILIKMDVQGYEDRVIAGGRHVFLKSHACITEISIDMLYQEQASFPGLIDVFANLGYRYGGNIHQAYGPDGHCVFFDALFIRDISQ